MPPPAPALMDDLVEDILLRLPPEDPGCLFRASLVCKRWRGLLTGRAFGRRYRQFHRSPPLLGFFENQFLGCWFTAPSSPTSPVPPIHPGHHCPDALDSCHGLVLLELKDREGVALGRLAVWDPLRRRHWEFPYPHLAGAMGFRDHTCSAAVLCAADGCDHLDCRAGGGPFLVACVCSDDLEEGVFYASLYSSVARAWSPVISIEHPFTARVNSKPKLLVGNSLYFTCKCEQGVMIVRYDMVRQELSIILLTNAGTFTIELNSGQVKNVPGRTLDDFPYSSFYTPDQAGGIMPPLHMASSSENIKAAQDALLQQPSMNAGEEREQGEEEQGEWKEDDDDEESGDEVEKDLEQAHNLFGSWSEAIVDGYFDFAELCAVDALECMFSCHGKLSPKCAYTYYIYGCTLLYKPRPDSEPSSERDDAEDMMSLRYSHDFNLALKMLHIARAILEKCPGSTMEEVKILSALADVKILSTLGRGSMRKEDIDYSLRVCFKALAISENLIESDNYWIIKLNVSICLIFELASNIRDAVACCAKAISLSKSRVSSLKNAKEALLLDKDDNVSAAEPGSERSALKYEIVFLTGMSCKLEKKLEHLEQAMSTPTTKASCEQKVGDATPRAASSTPKSAGTTTNDHDYRHTTKRQRKKAATASNTSGSTVSTKVSKLRDVFGEGLSGQIVDRSLL